MVSKMGVFGAMYIGTPSSHSLRYFTPHEIPSHGMFMDGGISFNNPSPLALQELFRLAPEFRRPDQFVSVGTGVSKKNEKKPPDTKSSVYFGKNSLYATAQHYLRDNFDGDKQFSSLRSMMTVTLPHASSCIDEWLRRFNLPLQGQLPDLANAPAMDGLADAALTHFSSDPAIHELARSILASSFYFQLRCMPMYEKGRYTCYGRIMCRIPVTHTAFAALMLKLDSMCAQFVVQGRVLHASKLWSSFDAIGNFSKPLIVNIRDLEDTIDIRLKLLKKYSHRISASPISARSLIRMQNLDWVSVRTVLPQTSRSSKRPCSVQSKTQSSKRRRTSSTTTDITKPIRPRSTEGPPRGNGALQDALTAKQQDL
jgi:hypothetical protein